MNTKHSDINKTGSCKTIETIDNNKLIQTAISFSLVSLVIVCLTLFCKFFDFKVIFLTGKYHLLLYILLAFFSLFMLVFIVDKNIFFNYNASEQIAISLNIFVGSLLLIIVVSRLTGLVIFMPTFFQKISGYYNEKDTLHIMLYMLILLANFFSISFFRCPVDLPTGNPPESMITNP